MSRLLRHAQRRVERVLQLVRVLKDDDFPHSDSAAVLAHVERQFVQHQETLSQLLPNAHFHGVIQRSCQSALDDTFVYLPVIGYVARSTDVIGALELHSPLHRIVTRVVGPHARLLLTSDWQYSPTTYVCEQLVQEGLVLVNLPASDADNGLIMPLAGHEIGHSVWYASQQEQYFEDLISRTLVELISQEENLKVFRKLFGDIERDQVDDLAGRSFWAQAYDWTVSQCEETFCDFVGLLLFNESYLFAFEYLLSPGGGPRESIYPRVRERVRHLIDLASRQGFPVDGELLESFQNEDADFSERDQFLTGISDQALELLVDQLADRARQSLADCLQNAHSDEERELVVSAFTRVTPVSGRVQLANLVNATWQIENAGITIWNKKYPRLSQQSEERSRILNELFLKSLEILEIEEIQVETSQTSGS